MSDMISDPWDPSTVGPQQDGTWEVLVRARVKIDGLVELKADMLRHPFASSDQEATPLMDDGQAVQTGVLGQLLAYPVNPQFAWTPLHVMLTAVPGSVAQGERA